MKEEFGNQKKIEEELRKTLKKFSNPSWQKYICISNVAKQVYNE